MESKTALKEAAAARSRHWVRLTRVCNNRCRFCHDKENQDGTCIPIEQVREDLEKGARRGTYRAILSGGEPTVHPRFAEIVSHARALRYERIQVVTNGRMFAYRDFLERAIEAGLDETTFSIHGHTAEIHDALTRVPGSFSHALRGLTDALASDRLIVNMDVVVNRRNIRDLRTMLEFFVRLGVREFDLLQLVPFGLAWENRADLFCDLEAHLGDLHGALDLGREPGILIWTNRLRAEYLEGYEDFIQSPTKLHDEVRGREEVFREWADHGTEPPCRGERCRWCFMESFCSAFAQAQTGGNGGPPRGYPPCLLREGETEAEPAPPVSDLSGFTAHFIRHAYRVKSARCRTCATFPSCPGAPIDLVRHNGFKILHPIGN